MRRVVVAIPWVFLGVALGVAAWIGWDAWQSVREADDTTTTAATTTAAPGTTAAATSSTTTITAGTTTTTRPIGPGIDVVGAGHYEGGAVVTFLDEGTGGQQFVGPSGVAFWLEEGAEIRAWADGDLFGFREEEWSTGFGVIRPHLTLVLRSAEPEMVDGEPLLLAIEIEGSNLHYPAGFSEEGIQVRAGEVIAVVGIGDALLPLGGGHRANVLLRFVWVTADGSVSLRFWDLALRFFPYLAAEPSTDVTTTTVRPSDWFESCYGTIGVLIDEGYAAMSRVGSLTVAVEKAEGLTGTWRAVADVAQAWLIPSLEEVLGSSEEVIAAEPDTVSVLAAEAVRGAVIPLLAQARYLVTSVIDYPGSRVDPAIWDAWWAEWFDQVQDLNDVLSRAPQMAYNCSD
ncbi:MAG: hypothetical protein MUE66_06835 [Acidimicrobiia bacterium]|nr:hypothetical protein [Acidimicrobiia bacterium]